MSGICDFSAADRNKKPVFDTLADCLTGSDNVLEIGSGDGTHARYALERLSLTCWQPSEAPGRVQDLAAALAGVDDPRLPAPLTLDVRGEWPQTRYDAIYAANVAHIMSMEAVAALFAGAGTHLAIDGLLCIYGPFFVDDEVPGEGNLAFDRSLRLRDPEMGVRNQADLDALAADGGLRPIARVAMPTDNKLLIWQRERYL